MRIEINQDAWRERDGFKGFHGSGSQRAGKK